MKQCNVQALAEAVERRAKDHLAEGHIGGASVLVEQNGVTLYENYFGTKDLKQEPITHDTLYRIASMTKPITGVATMILVERGLLSLEDRLDRFLPEFTTMRVFENESEEIQPGITVEQLLTHSSGIASGKVWKEYSLKRMPSAVYGSRAALIEFLATEPLSFLPGTKQEYSGKGAFFLLTEIIQQITGKGFEEFVREEIFLPCEMTDTTFEPSNEQWERMITMHDRQDGRSVEGMTYKGCVIDQFEPQTYLGGGGLISSLGDYLNFARMLLGGGSFRGRRILSEESVAEMIRPRVYKNDREWWGLSMRVITSEENNLLPVGAYGWSGAFGTHFWVDPVNQLLGIYLKNSRYDGGSGAKTSRQFEEDVYSSLEQ